MINTRTRTVGGHRLNAAITKALQATGIRSLQVGFFKSAVYADGTPVAAVAAFNEFGTNRNGKLHTPERPFMRQGVTKARPGFTEIVKDEIDSATLKVDTALGDRLGAYVAGQVQKRIVDLRDPPNAPSTLKRKAPKTNPLIVTGQMRTSVTWKVRR